MKLFRIISVFLLVCMTLSLFSCANVAPSGDGDRRAPITSVPNGDGEVTSPGTKPGATDSKGSSAGGFFDGIFGGKAEAEDAYMPEGTYAASTEGVMEYPAMDAPTGADDVYFTGAPSGIYGDDQKVYSAGTLTAGEWKDNKNFADWLAVLEKNEGQYAKIAESWGLETTERVVVTVKNGEMPVKNAEVELLDENQQVLWRAVSDAEGKAYLFNNVTKSTQDFTPVYVGGEPKHIRVSARGDQDMTLTTFYSGESEIAVNLEAKNAPVTLDLMLVVDTTGSMGDELEYLKAELKDVITRVSEAGITNVRTSVNFYRDEGDEYVVRYFGFRDSIDEAVYNMSTQYASGGGDYPEAVHTALENAVYDHAWDEGDSVKLMFLVLDAPPHENPAVMTSLQKTVADAAAKGIRIIPVLSSGTDGVCETLYRSIALLTGGTYAFLTNHSGIGNPHADQSVGAFNVEKLNDLMVRVITEYCQ